MPRCHVNADCWVDCCVWCMAYWKEPDGPCSKRTAHDKAQVFEFGGERMTITANQVPGDEVAAALKIPVGTARSDVFHARRALRKALAGWEQLKEDMG